MAKKDHKMIHREAVDKIAERARPEKAIRKDEKPRTNITYIVLRKPHRALRQYAFNHDVSLQQILDDLMERFFEEKALGPFERATGGEK